MEESVLSELDRMKIRLDEESKNVSDAIRAAKDIMMNISSRVGQSTDLGSIINEYATSMDSKANEVKAAGQELVDFMADRIHEQQSSSSAKGEAINDLKSAIQATQVK